MQVSLFYPTTNGGMQKWKAQLEHVRLAYTFLPRLPPDLHAPSAFISQVSAPELGRKFIKSALSVGWLTSPHWKRSCGKGEIRGRVGGFFFLPRFLKFPVLVLKVTLFVSEH